MATNRLITEKSPYLLQHASNPVNWFPWSEEAFRWAKSQDKPVFLSVGYATCHWCHVMEKDSFENESAAGYLNEVFVCIKVDREERPDVDSVYMSVCQMLTGKGGWPLTILMTPDKKPFFATTFIPRSNLVDLCLQVKDLWNTNREGILNAAVNVTEQLGKTLSFTQTGHIGPETAHRSYKELESRYDPEYGGFEQAPKFPTPHRILFLLRYYSAYGKAHALTMVTQTLENMRSGGIWDHVGFGFHRYSTDRCWLLPHFEKMLYDQALLLQAYTEAFQLTRDPFFSRTAQEIIRYVLRDMTDPEGGFYTAEDADSEGEEGRFYVWPYAELLSLLGKEDAGSWTDYYNVRSEGNFHDEATGQSTGLNILHCKPERLSKEEIRQTQWESVRQVLFEHRKKRIFPLKDDKILTDWNALMIGALAMAGRILEKPLYIISAQKALHFIVTRMSTPDGGLFHRYRDGEAAIDGQADDYAFIIYACLELYRSTFNPDYLTAAINWQNRMCRDFWDADQGGFFMTSSSHELLPVRPKEVYDGAIPSANSVSLYNLVSLYRLTGNPVWEDYAKQLIKAFSGSVASHPSSYTHFLLGLMYELSPGGEVVIVGNPKQENTRKMLDGIQQMYAPYYAVLLKTPENAERLAQAAPFTRALETIQDSPAAYVCTGFSCSRPFTDPDEFIRYVQKEGK